ncbi:MAG: hypothetical protein HKN18_18250 [Silicimonas sp.]|nr:hypothetical protein [Silicimonas sp.]
MSASYFVLIPADPSRESPENAEEIRTTLAKMLAARRSRLKDYGKLQFIDCGENFETIACPNCQAPITTKQWHAWMDEDWHGEEGFHLHRHETPCCGFDCTVNDLNYHCNQGFARWFISAEIDQKANLIAEELETLDRIAGFALKVIHQRY